MMSDNIEEVNKLIKEIEQERLQICIENQLKQRWQYQQKQHQLRKKRKRNQMIYQLVSGGLKVPIIYLAFLLISNTSHYWDLIKDDNLFDKQMRTIKEEEAEDIVTTLAKELNVVIPPTNVDNYLLLNAIRENNNLTEDDKQIFYQFIDLFEENPYMDKEATYTSLLNVNVIREERPEDIDEDVAGCYYLDDYRIEIFEEEEQDVICHEGVHCAFSTDENSTIPRFLKEGVTELQSKEYYTKDPYYIDRYPYEIAFVKVLCELVSPEKVLQTYTTGNMDIAYSELSRYHGGTKKEAATAIKCISEALDKVDETDKGVTLSKEHEEAIDYFNQCMTNKKENVAEFLSLDYFYNLELFNSIFSDKPLETYKNTLSYYGIIDKAYFSKDLKETGKNKVMLKQS